MAKDIARIETIWREARDEFDHGAGSGEFLFGEFSAADAMFAPVVTRFITYEVAISPACVAYCDTIMALPAMKEWVAAAEAEPDDIDELDAEF